MLMIICERDHLMKYCMQLYIIIMDFLTIYLWWAHSLVIASYQLIDQHHQSHKL